MATRMTAADKREWLDNVVSAYRRVIAERRGVDSEAPGFGASWGPTPRSKVSVCGRLHLGGVWVPSLGGCCGDGYYVAYTGSIFLYYTPTTDSLFFRPPVRRSGMLLAVEAVNAVLGAGRCSYRNGLFLIDRVPAPRGVFTEVAGKGLFYTLLPPQPGESKPCQ